MYLIISVTAGVLLCLMLVIGRLLVQRRRLKKDPHNLPPSTTGETTLPNGFADDISEIDNDIDLTAPLPLPSVSRSDVSLVWVCTHVRVRVRVCVCERAHAIVYISDMLVWVCARGSWVLWEDGGRSCSLWRQSVVPRWVGVGLGSGRGCLSHSSHRSGGGGGAAPR